ncbi:MAG: hypothetical protein LBQ54_06895 [Planctomycetaceae bacterium]|nr:hypothetical protein [Planctomycetaceae bacterium]
MPPSLFETVGMLTLTMFGSLPMDNLSNHFLLFRSQTPATIGSELLIRSGSSIWGAAVGRCTPAASRGGRQREGVTSRMGLPSREPNPLLLVAGVNRRKNVTNWKPKAAAMEQHVPRSESREPVPVSR